MLYYILPILVLQFLYILYLKRKVIVKDETIFAIHYRSDLKNRRIQKLIEEVYRLRKECTRLDLLRLGKA